VRRVDRVNVVALALHLATGIVHVDGRAVDIVAPLVVDCAVAVHPVDGELQLGAGGGGG